MDSEWSIERSGNMGMPAPVAWDEALTRAIPPLEEVRAWVTGASLSGKSWVQEQLGQTDGVAAYDADWFGYKVPNPETSHGFDWYYSQPLAVYNFVDDPRLTTVFCGVPGSNDELFSLPWDHVFILDPPLAERNKWQDAHSGHAIMREVPEVERQEFYEELSRKCEQHGLNYAVYDSGADVVAEVHHIASVLERLPESKPDDLLSLS